MRNKFFTAVAFTALMIMMSSFVFIPRKTNNPGDEFWKQLGITEKDVKSNISSGFFHPLMPDWRPFQKIAKENRPALVIAAGNYTKQYVSMPAFEKEYKLYRDGQIKANTPPPGFNKRTNRKEKYYQPGKGYN
jgi:hypothetical protein